MARRFEDVPECVAEQGIGRDMAIALVGPTAAGKTAVAIAVAQRLGAEIISADSMQVYRGMDIGTAKPTAEEQETARFHLVDVVDPDAEWTLADVQAAGSDANADIQRRGHLPLIVGGTGLYVRALTTQLDIPAAAPDEAFRERWRAFAMENGNAALHAELAGVDPGAAARIHVNDVKRIVRALEVYEATGTSMSELHARNQSAHRNEDSLIVGLNYEDRRSLYARINQRVDQMIADGLVDEVRRLLALGYTRELKSMQSLGYKQMASYLAGECDLADAVDDTKRATRHFARRQLIWFRADQRVKWVRLDDRPTADVVDEVSHLALNYCKTHQSMSV